MTRRPYKYEMSPDDPDYHKAVARISNMKRTYIQQCDRWSKIVDLICHYNRQGMSNLEIVDKIVKTTEYKIIERGKDVDYSAIDKAQEFDSKYISKTTS